MNIRSTPLVQMADEARRPSRWWLAWIVAILLVVVPSGLGSVVGNAVLGSPASTDTSYQYVEAFIFGFTLIALAAWVVLKEKRPFTSIGFRGSAPARRLVVGLVVGAAMMCVGVLVPTAMGQYASGASSHTNTGSAALLSLLPLALLFVLQGSTEEAVTRGYMLQMGGRQLPAWVAVLGSSVIFAVVHLDFHPLPLLNITLYAVFASFVALEQGSLWLICGIHAGWNFFQGNVFGLPVSGNAEATSLFSYGPAAGSSELLTGGNFGVEASVIGTAVLAVACVVAYARLRRARTPQGMSTPREAATA